MLLADALIHCPRRASPEIRLDVQVDYIAFTNAWIEKLRDTTSEDPILRTVSAYSTRLAAPMKTCTTDGKNILGLKRLTFYG